MASGDDDRSFLVILLETHPKLLGALLQYDGLGDLRSQRQGLSFPQYITQVLCFINSFLLLNAGNRLAIFATHAGSSPLLYMTNNLQPEEGLHGGISNAGDTAEVLTRRLRSLSTELASSEGTETPLSPVSLSGSLSRALCFIAQAQARVKGRREPAQPRILVLHGSPDVPEQYMAVMNAVFAAQRQEVIIDACMVAGRDSSYLHQAANLTAGVYRCPSDPDSLLQHLLALYLSDPYTRQFLTQPATKAVDGRASCFCHRRPIDQGFICSVCLSVFCERLEECKTCGTRFESATKRKGSGTDAGQTILNPPVT